MSPINEAAFEDALSGAVEEAVEEMEAAEVETEENTEEVSSDDTSESAEEITEPVEVEDDVEADGEEVEEAAEPPSVEMWNGNPDELPPAVEYEGRMYDLTQTYKAMQAGFTKKTQELAEQRKQYEQATQQALEQYRIQKAAVAEREDPRPPNPTEGMSLEDQEKAWSEISQWEARQAYKGMVKDGTIPDPDAVKQQMEQQQAQVALANRVALVESQQGFNEAVSQEMQAIAQGDESGYWLKQFETDEGALALFQFAKNKVDAEVFKKTAADFENAKVKRSAQAASRATPKQTAQNKAAEPKPADNFAELAFDDKIEAIVNSEFGL